MSTRTTDEIAADVSRLADLQAVITEATDEANSIKGRLRVDYAEDPGTHGVAGFLLSVTPAMRFNADRAREVLASQPEILAAATVTPEPTLDGKVLKRMVAPAIYDLCCVSAGDARVSLR